MLVIKTVLITVAFHCTKNTETFFTIPQFIHQRRKSCRFRM